MKMTQYPVAVWWQALENIEKWVKTRGVNVLIYQDAISGTPGDFQKMHQAVESLRQQGYPLWVIRSPGYMLKPDPQPLAFDQQWADHLLAFTLPDEFEDKVTGGNLYSNPQPIIDFAAARIAAVKAWTPEVKIFANFNGTHMNADTIGFYSKLMALGIDIGCQDCYPLATQQIKYDGSFLYQLADFVKGSTLLKAATGKPCWTYIETCNQDVCPAGQPGWTPAYKFVGSRCPTVDELWQQIWYAQQAKADGIVYFPQARNGAVNDATPPEIGAILAAVGKRLNPPAPVRTLTKTILVYSDGSIDAK